MTRMKTYRQFRAAVCLWERAHRPVSYPGRRTEAALYACWWFIENVSFDDPDRTDIFFKLREMVRAASSGG